MSISNKPYFILKLSIFVFVCAIILSFLLPSPKSSFFEEHNKIVSIDKEQKAKPVSEEEYAKRHGLKWHYEQYADKMSKGIEHVAVVNSLNLVYFDFPYHGPQRAELRLRKHPRYGNDVILSIMKGQFHCGVSNCQLSVRFDQGKAQKFTAVEPADHSSTTLFIRGYDRFLTAARKSKKVYIEATFFRAGIRVLEFDISGLEW